MKTTNLFVDFLVIGFVGMLTLIPFQEFIRSHLTSMAGLSIQKSFILPLLMACIYIIGMLFYQLSDYFIKGLQNISFFSAINKSKENTFPNSGAGYNESLQTVISRSGDAYSYLSYRRSIIRIFRALILSMFLGGIATLLSWLWLHQISGAIGSLLLGLYVSVFLFASKVYSKNMVGYNQSIAIFYRILSGNEGVNNEK